MVCLSVSKDHFAEIDLAVRRADGYVLFEEQRVGYIRAYIPSRTIHSVTHLPGIDAVEVIDNASEREFLESALPAFTQSLSQAAKADTDLPRLPAPDFASHEIGLDNWVRKHPTFDGRGTVIGIVATWCPAFSSSGSLAMHEISPGIAVPKFLDVVPVSDVPNRKIPSFFTDSAWLDVSDQHQSIGDKLNVGGLQYHVPHPGTFGLVFFRNKVFERLDNFGGALSNKLRHLVETDRSYAVLWDPRTRTIRINTSGDRDFSKDEEVGEYSRHHIFGRIVYFDGYTPVTLGYALCVSGDGHSIYIALGVAGHATMVSSTAAGNRSLGGMFNGVAPNAQLISYVVGNDEPSFGTGYGALEAVLRAESDPRVDVVSCSCGILIRGYATSEPVTDQILHRLGSAFGKPFIYAQGYEPGVIGVGGYNSSRMFARNLGITDAPDETWPAFVHNDGTVVPDFVAPERSLSADSRLEPLLYTMITHFIPPKSYFIGGGASNAIPFGVGVIADLASGAKQTGIKYDLSRLWAALWTGSRSIRVVGTSEVARLLQLEPSWRALVALNSSEVPSFSVDTPVNRVERPPTNGFGLLDETAQLGTTFSRVIGVQTTRALGPSCCHLQIQNDDGSFAVQPTVNFESKKRAAIALTESPRGYGEHISYLAISDWLTHTTLKEIPLTMRVPLVAGAHPISVSFEVGDGTTLTEYLAKPSPGQIHVRVATEGTNVDLFLISPNFMFYEINGRTGSYLPPQWQASGVSVHSRSHGHLIDEDITISSNGEVWQLSIDNNAQRGDFRQAGPVYIRAAHQGLHSRELTGAESWNR